MGATFVFRVFSAFKHGEGPCTPFSELVQWFFNDAYPRMAIHPGVYIGIYNLKSIIRHFRTAKYVGTGFQKYIID